jgi:hypothetical protein
VETAAACKLSGGGCGERADCGEEAARWRRARQTGKCSAKEAIGDGGTAV